MIFSIAGGLGLIDFFVLWSGSDWFTGKSEGGTGSYEEPDGDE